MKEVLKMSQNPNELEDVRIIDTPPQNLTELKDYELIPNDEDEQAWAVRLLSGPYVETVIKFGAISFNRVKEGVMTFNFTIISSPDSELTTDDVSFQDYVGDILQAVIRDGMETGSVMTRESENESK